MMNNDHDRLTGPWMSYDAVPHVLREFDMNRDPYIRAQLLDMEKTEKQRRDEQEERNSGMVKNDVPHHTPKPPRSIRAPVDREHFEQRWLLEEREAVFAQASLTQSRDERIYERSHLMKELSR